MEDVYRNAAFLIFMKTILKLLFLHFLCTTLHAASLQYTLNDGTNNHAKTLTLSAGLLESGLDGTLSITQGLLITGGTVTGPVLFSGPGTGGDPSPFKIHDGTDKNFSIYGRSDWPYGLWFAAANDANSATVPLSFASSETHFYTSAGATLDLNSDGSASFADGAATVDVSGNVQAPNSIIGGGQLMFFDRTDQQPSGQLMAYGGAAYWQVNADLSNSKYRSSLNQWSMRMGDDGYLDSFGIYRNDFSGGSELFKVNNSGDGIFYGGVSALDGGMIAGNDSRDNYLTVNTSFRGGSVPLRISNSSGCQSNISWMGASTYYWLLGGWRRRRCDK